MSSSAIEVSNQIASWIEERKGKDIQILDISELTTLTDCFVLASGTSTLQVQSIAGFVEEKAKEKNIELRRKEGYQGGRWILLDYNNVIVHIFHEEERDFYNLERLWLDAKKIDFYK
ncbi:MAG TPA: ribosome silencing factor [Eubacteriaceae bacterium]|nr:ribosome silencing factor [Eubacteriaceae bacterium]